nr:hypothetical protein [uncultured Dongia sp.]
MMRALSVDDDVGPLLETHVTRCLPAGIRASARQRFDVVLVRLGEEIETSGPVVSNLEAIFFGQASD